MPQVTPEYEPLQEFIDLAKQLVEKHSGQFSGINLDTIRAVAITNKERSEKNPKLFEILPVKQPVRLDCIYAYYIIIHQSDWESLDNKHKLMLIAQCLCAIPLNENGEMDEGAVNAFDMKDYATMLRSFGVDYLVREDVPDLLNDDITWKS